ncbi:MAG TPA: sulfotransferase [Gaiellaceae bacterium]|jgi:hypothetical protein
MAISQEEQETTAAAGERPPSQASQRSLVLVAGSGRSGTSLFSGILQRLGFYVPKPEVPADSTNPRGFAESKWVVDFHAKLLRRAGVQTADARPAAWAHTADVGLDEDAQEELSIWLGKQFKSSDHIIVKDPRLSWFLPLWRRAAQSAGVSPRFATVLRHPAAVVESKQRSYGGWQTDVNRTAGWLNQTLFTERATREGPRVFVRYEDLLEDWTKIVGRVGETLDLSVIRDAPAASIVSVHEFVDRGLSRSRAAWDDYAIPQALREQVDVVWELISRLAEEDGRDEEAVLDELEVARAAYVSLYEDAEAIAQSSIVAAQRVRARKAKPGNKLFRVAGKMPRRYKERIPVRWRKAAFRATHRGSRKRR